MICECDAPVPSHLRMSHTVIRKPRMHGSPERNPGVIEILESKVLTVSSPSRPGDSPLSPQSDYTPRRVPHPRIFEGGDFFPILLLTTRSRLCYITPVKNCAPVSPGLFLL
jgi:hypothetical protein